MVYAKNKNIKKMTPLFYIKDNLINIIRCQSFVDTLIVVKEQLLVIVEELLKNHTM